MNKCMMVVGVLMGCLSAWSGVKTWTGNGTGWSDAASWDPQGEPAATDTVVFSDSATVAPPASFCGVVSIEAGVLTLSATDSLSLTLAVKDGAHFVKSGTGTVKAKACPAVEAGYQTGGAITVAEGKMQFAGNGHGEAPGYFGRLEVSADATAEVVESPSVGRHGGLWRTIQCGKGQSQAEECIHGMFGTYDASNPGAPNLAAIAANWAAAGADPTLSGLDYWRFCDQTVDGVYPFRTESLPAAVKNSHYLVLVARGIVISDGSAIDFAQNCFTRYRALIGLSGLPYQAASSLKYLPVTPTRGWNALDCGLLRIYSDRVIETRIDYHLGTDLDYETHLGVDTLWNGVCFSSVVLADAASLEVGNGQAVALSGAEASTFGGTVSGGADSVFALMAGAWSPDWTAFSTFPGVVEVGRLATLTDCGTDFGELPFTLVSRGTIVAAEGLSGLTDACTGVVRIPSGVTVTADGSLLGAARVKGEGQIAVTGNVPADGLERISVPLVLTDGSKLTMPRDGLMKKDGRALLDGWTPADGWQIAKNAVGEAEGHPAGVIDGKKLTLVQAPGQQKSLATYVAHALSPCSTLDVSFKVRAVHPCYPEYPQPSSDSVIAEGWGFVLYDGDTQALSADQVAVPAGAFGFSLNYWLGLNFRWEINGEDQTVENMENAGFKRLDETDVRIGLTNGTMTVTFSQPQNGNVRRTFARDIGEAFALSSRGSCALGMSAGTASGATYAKMDFWDLRGDFRTYNEVLDLDRRTSMDVSSDNWCMLTDASITNDNEMNIVEWKDNSFGRCYAKTPLSAFEPFTLEFDIIHDRVYSANNITWANGWAVSFQDEGDFSTLWWAADGADAYYGSQVVPVVHNGFTIQRRWYVQKNFICSTTIDRTCTTIWKSPTDPGGLEVDPLVIGEAGYYHVSLAYDGKGLIEATFSQPNRNHSYSFTQYFPNYSQMRDGKMYLTFTSSVGAQTSYMEAMRIRNLKVSALSSNGARTAAVPMTVAPGDSATLASSAIVLDSPTGLTCSDVSLGTGATLNVETDDAPVTWIGLTLLNAFGEAAVASGEGSTVELSTIDLTKGGGVPYCLEVTGAWTAKDGMLTFVVPRVWSGSFMILKADPDLYAGEGEPQFFVVDESGRAFKNREVRRTDGGYVLQCRGLSIIVR